MVKIFIRILILSFLIQAHEIVAQELDEDVQVVLLAGQSNMAGGGNYDKLSDSIKERVDCVSHRVSLSFNGKKATPLSYYKNKPSKKYKFKRRFGPELLMGVCLAEKYPDKTFLLIKRSQGGTSLYGAWNPKWSAEKAKQLEKGTFKQNLKLYQLHIKDIERNLEELRTKKLSYQVVGLTWMQGENDAAKEVAAKSYKKNLRKLIVSYKRDLGLSKLPFVAGQTNSRYGDFEGGPEMVRAAIEKVANSDYYSDYIATKNDIPWDDYPKHSDNVHYNSEGQFRLGTKFAEKIIDLNQKTKR